MSTLILLTIGMIWTPHDWLSKFYLLYGSRLVGIVILRPRLLKDVALELKCIIMHVQILSPIPSVGMGGDYQGVWCKILPWEWRILTDLATLLLIPCNAYFMWYKIKSFTISTSLRQGIWSQISVPGLGISLHVRSNPHPPCTRRGRA